MTAHKVYLSACTQEASDLRNELCEVLKSAGMEVLSEQDLAPAQQATHVSALLKESNTAVVFLEPKSIRLEADGRPVFWLPYLMHLAQQELSARQDFNIIVWLSPRFPLALFDPDQQQFVNEVRNNIGKNMVFTNAASAIELVDDLRSLLDVKETTLFDLKDTEIFLISNQLDDYEANEVVDMLMDIVPVEKLSIIQDSDMDYSEYCSQQIGKSKLAVVYFKESGDWALPFAQQVWKKIGGASSHTPILLIGDEDPETNMNKKFKAPKVMSLIVSGELIPLEIKVQYDKITELLQK